VIVFTLLPVDWREVRTGTVNPRWIIEPLCSTLVGFLRDFSGIQTRLEILGSSPYSQRISCSSSQSSIFAGS
jgi:hypothetical protein